MARVSVTLLTVLRRSLFGLVFVVLVIIVLALMMRLCVIRRGEIRMICTVVSGAMVICVGIRLIRSVLFVYRVFRVLNGLSEFWVR